jgi:Uma2 family endonuclease
LAVNLLLALALQVRSAGCRINVSDVKVKIRRRFRYPDLVVTCDQRDQEAITLFQYPQVIVEVLSPGTESTDRGEKLQEYQSLPTLEEYVLISADRQQFQIQRLRWPPAREWNCGLTPKVPSGRERCKIVG